MAKNNDTVPIEVTILTSDHDIKGVVHVSKYTNTNGIFNKITANMRNIY